MVFAGGRCDLRCSLCDCDTPGYSDEKVRLALEGGGSQLIVRGAAEHSADIGTIVARARQQGFADIVLRTNAIASRTAEGAAAFARLRADAALVPIFSQNPTVHDRIAGRPKALIDTLAGIKNLARAGQAIEIEVPILSTTLQSLEQIVRLVHKLAPSLRSVQFYLPSSEGPKTLAPPPWTVGGPELAKALYLCRDLGIRARLSGDQGVPLCALRNDPELHDVYVFNPKARSSVRGNATMAAVCSQCVVRAHCPGLVPSYRAANGEEGIVPYRQRPRLMYEQRTTRRRVWTAAQRAAAKKPETFVLRPTVNCNQDCTFCSANETSNNVWANHQDMLRAIARAARRGIEWLSFSGGEPTLSKHLVEYIHCASRLKVPKIELITNAVLLDKKEKVQALVDAGLTDAFISLHAHDEELSRQSTQKIGDFARTVQGIKNFVAADIRTTINHVISARNYPYLRSYVEFVRREFGGQVKISFAFVTPQFKALDNIEVMPRLSTVMPHLKRAMYRALEIGQPFNVGARQGIPFCFLDEFRPWSDGLKQPNSATAEDSPQKQRAPGCDQCRYSNYCNGLWNPYVAKYGLDEIRPIPGAILTEAEVLPLLWSEPWGIANSFDEVPEILRERDLEKGPPETGMVAVSSSQPFVTHRTRPLRVAMLGSGRQARRLARAAAQVAGFSIDAIASPHAPQADLHEFQECPTYTEAATVMSDIRPEGVIIAAATRAHFELAQLAVEQGIPALLEKPVTSNEEQAVALRDLARAKGVAIVPAHNSLYATGLDEVLAVPFERVSASYVWRRTPQSGDTMHTWSRSFLYETIYHVLVVVGRACGGGPAEVMKASLRGDAVPENVRLELRYGAGSAEMVLDFAAAVEEDVVTRRGADAATETTWRREGRAITIRDRNGVRLVESQGSDAERMIANFRDVVLGIAPPGATLDEAIDVMASARRVVEALATAGAPFEQPNAPRHVASRGLGHAYQ